MCKQEPKLLLIIVTIIVKTSILILYVLFSNFENKCENKTCFFSANDEQLMIKSLQDRSILTGQILSN